MSVDLRHVPGQRRRQLELEADVVESQRPTDVGHPGADVDPAPAADGARPGTLDRGVQHDSGPPDRLYRLRSPASWLGRPDGGAAVLVPVGFGRIGPRAAATATSRPNAARLRTMTVDWERHASATGSRLHWARRGDSYALCGSAVLHQTGQSPPAGPECRSCARKLTKVQAAASAKAKRQQ